MIRCKTLHLHAMGAAIPHLARLAVSLPSILPYDPSVIQTEVLTGTTEVQDEIIPDDEDEDISIRTRGKSTMSVTIKIEGGDDEDTRSTTTKTGKEKGRGKREARREFEQWTMGFLLFDPCSSKPSKIHAKTNSAANLFYGLFFPHQFNKVK